MVAKITVPQSVRRALNYNEQKVKQGKAECLHAANFLKDHDQMNFHEKLERFQRNIELNKSKTNTLHISLNFDPSDKIDIQKMLSIAKDYMEKIGFGKQPYLVYQHNDAGHPHCHIVTTNIKDDGKRIDTYNIAKKMSEPARKAIENDYGLMRAEGRKQQQALKQTEPAQTVQYGQSETKRSITNVLDAVIDQYKYSSLAELNAVLRLYNVAADRGKAGSRTHEKRGLHYRIIDNDGNKIGVPIKASSIYSKPTLNNLEKKFTGNALLKVPDRQDLKTAIDWTLAQRPKTIKDFVGQLGKENIGVVLRQSEKGQLFGLTYIDHRNKTVFNGSELGKRYAAKEILEQLNGSRHHSPEPTPQKTAGQSPSTGMREQNSVPVAAEQNQAQEQESRSSTSQWIDQILQPEGGGESMPKELLEEERRRRRRSLNLDEEHEM